MCNKNVSRLLAFAAFATLLVVSTLTFAQSPPEQANEVTGGGAAGRIPVFTAAHKIGNSIMKQAGGSISVAGGVSAVSGGSSATDGVFGGNTGFGFRLSSQMKEPIRQRPTKLARKIAHVGRNE